ncbi:MAG TPA: hypothetical protein VGO40_13510 [Longimicrobium sp.]|nr:hypothetical protein [Longimicrobium sp.]
MKRKLQIDMLEVESFDTSGGGAAMRGTVRAHELTEVPCLQDTNYQSCGWSDIDCYTEGCRTDWNTCGAYGSCCPAVCW